MITLSRRLHRFESRVTSLVESFRKFDHGGDLSVHEVYIIERALMQLQIEWELFVRGLILDSATGEFMDSAGNPVVSSVASIPTRERAGHYLVSTYPKRKTEPDWYLPKMAIDAAHALGVSNYPQISAELGITPWSLDELRHIRNFIAHRSKKSALTLKGLGLTVPIYGINPTRVAFSYSSSGVKQYESWADFMKYVARRLVV